MTSTKLRRFVIKPIKDFKPSIEPRLLRLLTKGETIHETDYQWCNISSDAALDQEIIRNELRCGQSHTRGKIVNSEGKQADYPGNYIYRLL